MLVKAQTAVNTRVLLLRPSLHLQSRVPVKEWPYSPWVAFHLAAARPTFQAILESVTSPHSLEDLFGGPLDVLEMSQGSERPWSLLQL